MNIKRSAATALAALAAATLAACTPTPTQGDQNACAGYEHAYNSAAKWQRETTHKTFEEKAERTVQLLDEITTARKHGDTQELRDTLINVEQGIQNSGLLSFFFEVKPVVDMCEKVGAPINLDGYKQ